MNRFHFRIPAAQSPHGQAIDSTTKAESANALRTILDYAWGPEAARAAEIWEAVDRTEDFIQETERYQA